MHLDSLPLLEMAGGAKFDRELLLGKWTVLYFYPKDNTPGCTSEGQEFRDRFAAFAAAGAQVIGVSRDSLSSHERFREKQRFPFPLVSDPEEALCRLFDVIREKKLYGKTHMGVERTTFLLDPKGEIVREWRKVKVKGHVEEVLEAVREFSVP